MMGSIFFYVYWPCGFLLCKASISFPTLGCLLKIDLWKLKTYLDSSSMLDICNCDYFLSTCFSFLCLSMSRIQFIIFFLWFVLFAPCLGKMCLFLGSKYILLCFLFSSALQLYTRFINKSWASFGAWSEVWIKVQCLMGNPVDKHLVWYRKQAGRQHLHPGRPEAQWSLVTSAGVK